MSVLGEIQVIELSTGMAGSLVGMLMCDFGAEVVKVEGPGGDPARCAPGFAVWNRGKRSVIVDPADRSRSAWLGDLIAGADVCLVNDFGALGEYGLDADELRKRNSQLVFVETPPYATTTPWFGGHESHGLLAALSGLAWRQSSYGGVPVDMVAPQFLYVQGAWGAVCAVAALVERERSGVGQKVTVTGMNAVMEGAVSPLTTTAGTPDPSTAVGPGGRHPTYSRFEAGDGRWLACGGLGAKFETAVLRAVGLGDLLDAPRMGGGIAGLLDPANITWAAGQVVEAFRTRERDEWLKILGDAGVPCGPLDDAERWLDHPQVRAIGLRAEVDDPERGVVTMAGIPINLTRSPGRVTGPAPQLGAHAGDVTPRTPRPLSERAAPLAPGPLAGFRILDLGTFVAGPYTGFLLAELGADVVKVEPCTGDPFRFNGFPYNRGMRSLAINLRSPDGLAAFHRLAETSDAVVNSLRPGVPRKLGIDYQALSAARADIITVGLSGYGEGGPMEGQPGVDMVLQGMSGMMSQQGGSSEPVSNTLAIIDTTTGALGALAVVLSLFHRQRTGEGQHVWFSLMGTATYLQSGETVRYTGRPDPRVGGRDHPGPHALDRFYEVADGWVRVQAKEPGTVRAEHLRGAGLTVSDDDFAADAAHAIGRAVGTQGADEVVRRLARAGIAAVRARRISEVQADEELLETEFVHIRPAVDGAAILVPGRYARFSRTQRRGPLPVAGIGEHSAAILNEAGLEDGEIARLVASGTVVHGGPVEQRLAPLYR